MQRSVPHGDVAAAHAMATKLGVPNLLGPKCRDRDLAYALVLSRVVRPASKLSTALWWQDTTLGEDIDVAAASTDEVYAAMDWLLARQDTIEAQLVKRHLRPGGIAMFDLSSSWVESRCCELAAFGHSRDNKRGTEQIEYGLLTDADGRPVAIQVFPWNTSDSESLNEAITVVRDKFDLNTLIMVGDRGMLAAYLVWHLRKALAPLTFTDEHIPERTDPVSPATRSQPAKDKDKTKQTTDELPVRSFPDLLDHLGTLTRQTINFAGQYIQKITTATPTQRRAFELIGAPIPLALT